MKMQLLAAWLAALGLAGCGFDATPQSSGTSGSTSSAEPATTAEPVAATGEKTEGEKNAD